MHEEVYRATLSETVRRFSAEAPRGEFTLVIEGAPEPAATAGAGPRDGSAGAALNEAEAAAAARGIAREALARASAEGCSAQESVRRAAETSGLRRNEVYRMWLAIKQEAGQ
jgi:16S rRNA (cytidine1402-2'-O)-methyltransferase